MQLRGTFSRAEVVFAFVESLLGRVMLNFSYFGFDLERALSRQCYLKPFVAEGRENCTSRSFFLGVPGTLPGTFSGLFP